MRCWFCGGSAIHLHHVIRQQRLKRDLPKSQHKEALADRRNLIPSCWTCHGKVHNGAIKETVLPEGFWQFVDEHQLFGALPRHLMEQAA